MRNQTLLCALTAILLTATAPALAQNPADQTLAAETLDYVVLPGDTLIDLAHAYLNQPSDYRHVQRHNRVANPRRLPIGRTLALPLHLLRATPDVARIANFRGAVTLSQQGRSGAPRPGETVSENAVLSTGPNAFVRLALSDGGHVAIPSNSRVRLIRLRRYVINGAVDHALSVETGRAESSVTPRQRPGGFEIRTPVSVSAVRGTEFRVAFDADAERSATSVIKGAVAVSPENGSESVIASAAEGVSSSRTDATLAALLPAPHLLQPDAVQTGADVVFAITDQPGARRYRGRLATDAGMIDAFAETQSETDTPRLIYSDLADGAYFLRLSALSADGMEGRDATYSFVRARNGVGKLTSANETVERRRLYRFRWEAEGEGDVHFRFQLSHDAADSADAGPPLIDQPGLAEDAFTLTDLPPGVYNWRVQATRHRFGRWLQVWSEPQQLRIGR